MPRSIKREILFSHIALVSFAILVLGISGFLFILKRIDNDKKALLRYYTHQEAEEFESYFALKKNILERIAQSKEVVDYSVNYRDLALLEYFSKFKNEYTQLSYLNAKGIEEVKMAGGNASGELLDLRATKIFRDALKNPGRVVVSYTENIVDPKDSSLKFALAKYDYFNDTLVGVTMGACSVNKVMQDVGIALDAVGTTGFYIVIDREGDVLFHPQKDKIFTKIIGKDRRSQDLILNATLMQEGLGMATLCGTYGLAYYAPLKSADWSLLAVYPYRELVFLPHILGGLTLLILLLALIGGIILSSQLTRKITLPLKNLGEATAKLAKGDFTGKVELENHIELQDIAIAFNKIVEDLEKITVSRNKFAEEVGLRQKAEEELKNAYEQLRTTQFQLVQTAKMASVGQLAGGVAHEINNPLTGVLNNVQLIKMEAQMQKDFNLESFTNLLNTIEESAFRCKKITDSLLGFSRAATGKFLLVSVNELVEKIYTIISYELRLQNIVVKTELAPDLPQIFGEPQLLQQVIFDLVTNAKWAVEKKPQASGRAIMIKTAFDAAAQRVLIIVSDTGVGIPEEHLPRIFEPFFTTKPAGEGTGLGLSIIHNIIKQHNADISVESKIGEGTSFKISLPIIKK